MIIILDTETSGFSGSHEVLELGAVCLNVDVETVGTFSSLVRPSGPVDLDALKINGLTMPLLDAAPSADAVFSAFIAWARLGGSVQLVTAFNVSFDKRMMGQTWPASLGFPWGECIMRRASQVLRGNRSSYKLLDACTALGVVRGPSQHRALADAQAAAAVFVQLRRRGEWSE